MDRTQWAAVYADACLNYETVMNQAELVYDPETQEFSWGSSLTPGNGEIVVDGDCQWEYHTQDEKPTLEELTEYFKECADDLWREHVNIIEETLEESDY